MSTSYWFIQTVTILAILKRYVYTVQPLMVYTVYVLLINKHHAVIRHKKKPVAKSTAITGYETLTTIDRFERSFIQPTVIQTCNTAMNISHVFPITFIV